MIRKLVLLDLPQLLALGEQYVNSLDVPMKIDMSYIAKMAAYGLTAKNFVCLGMVDEDKNALVGFIWGAVNPGMFTPDLTLSDILTFILPEYRGKGLSKELFAEYERRGKELGAKFIQLSTISGSNMEETVEVYERFGYNLTGYITTKEV